MTHDLDIIRMERKKHSNVRGAGASVEGDLPVRAVSAGEGADNYVRIEKVKSENEKEESESK